MSGRLPESSYSPNHPHPHVDPRQPVDETATAVNPPVFAWHPGVSQGEQATYSFVLSASPEMDRPVIEARGLTSPMFLPEDPLPAGRYFWRWTSEDGTGGDTWSFVVTAESAIVQVPPAEKIRSLASGEHPKIFVRASEVEELRTRYNQAVSGSSDHNVVQWAGQLAHSLVAKFDSTLAEPHEMEEPPMLADRRIDFDAHWQAWYRINWASRTFMHGAELLSLAYLLTGQRKYGESSARRLLSVTAWDPDGSSSISENDEAHMSVFRHMPVAADLIWEILDEDERRAILSHIRKRGINTFEHSRKMGEYGVTRFDSHAGREIVFLGVAALAFADEIPEAEEWLEWLRPVLCGIWPVWGKDDGGWAEGPAYGLTYITIMTMFASGLKTITGADLYRKPFWQNHSDWRRAFHPPYAQWIGFGDHTERWQEFWQGTSYLVRLLDLETHQYRHPEYANEMFEESREMTAPVERGTFPFPSQLAIRALLDQSALEEKRTGSLPDSTSALQVFPDVGWASVSTDLYYQKPDIRFSFRSSPYGSVSHSHANNNDFALHVAGNALLIPSGYFAGFSSNHHAHWVWHTKSHNAATLGGSSQFIRSYSSRGAVMGAYEDDNIVYFCGVADPSYAHMADAYRRHVVYLKGDGAFVITDEIVLRPGVFVPVEWNLHSWWEFSTDREQRSCSVIHDGAGVEITYLSPFEFYFATSKGWVPPPNTTYKESSQWTDQYHLQIVPSDVLARTRILSAVLAPFHAERKKASVSQSPAPEAGHSQASRIEHEATVGTTRICCHIPAPPAPGSLYGLPDQRKAVDKAGTIIASDELPTDGPIMSITVGASEYRIERTGLAAR